MAAFGPAELRITNNKTGKSAKPSFCPLFGAPRDLSHRQNVCRLVTILKVNWEEFIVLFRIASSNLKGISRTKQEVKKKNQEQAGKSDETIYCKKKTKSESLRQDKNKYLIIGESYIGFCRRIR